jgi:hypothetical protein
MKFNFSSKGAVPDTTLDIILVVLFILFLALQIEIPRILADLIDTPVGISVVILSAFYMFFFTTPVLGVLSLIVAYEILRRSSKKTGRYSLTQFLPTQEKRDAEMRAMNPSRTDTLEEEMVEKMAPLGVSNISKELQSEFHPVNEEIHNATVLP